jgi:hypothetical protein
VSTRAFSFLPLSGIYLLVLIPLSLTFLIPQPVLRPIKQSDRAAMQFIADNTPEDAKFVVLMPQSWFEADSAEWFPLLAQRQSLTTPQGLEWISSAQFLEISRNTFDLSALVRSAQGGNDSGEIVRYVEKNFPDLDYVAIFASDLEKTSGGFLETGRFELVYSRKNVLVFFRTSTLDSQ